MSDMESSWISDNENHNEIVDLDDEMVFDDSGKEVIQTELPLVAKEDAALLEQINSIPDKMAFKIGEVADIAGVKQYVLRYWETEFDVLRPKKSRHNQRMYTRKDVETVLLIKKLLYVDRFSISGARAAIRKKKKDVQRKDNIQKSFEKVGQVSDKLKALKAEIQKVSESFR